MLGVKQTCKNLVKSINSFFSYFLVCGKFYSLTYICSERNGPINAKRGKLHENQQRHISSWVTIEQKKSNFYLAWANLMKCAHIAIKYRRSLFMGCNL